MPAEHRLIYLILIAIKTATGIGFRRRGIPTFSVLFQPEFPMTTVGGKFHVRANEPLSFPAGN